MAEVIKTKDVNEKRVAAREEVVEEKEEVVEEVKEEEVVEEKEPTVPLSAYNELYQQALKLGEKYNKLASLYNTLVDKYVSGE